MKLQLGGLPIKERGIGAKRDLLNGPGFEEGFDTTAAFEFGDVDPSIWQGLQRGMNHGAAGIEHHHTSVWKRFEQGGEGFEIHAWGL